MTFITRRGALGMLAGVAVPVPVGIAAAKPDTSPTDHSERMTCAHDPIIDAIRELQAGMTAYNGAADDDDAEIARTYGPPLAVIKNWSEPAVTRQGAIEALRFANLEIMGLGADETIQSMLWAALAYFEREH